MLLLCQKLRINFRKQLKVSAKEVCFGDEISNRKLKTNNSNDCVDTGNYLVCPILTIW